MPPANPKLPVPVEHRADERASGLQICLTAIATIFILGVFFYGISNQRTETGSPNGRQMAATQVSPAAQPAAQESGGAQAPGGSTTTGQASDDQNNGRSGKQQLNSAPAQAQPQQNGTRQQPPKSAQ